MDFMLNEIKETFEAWEERGKSETTLAVSLKEDGRIEVTVHGDGVVFPFLLGNLLCCVANDTKADINDMALMQTAFAHTLDGAIGEVIEKEEIKDETPGFSIKFNEGGKLS